MIQLNKKQSDVLCQLNDGLCTVTQAVATLLTTGIVVQMLSYKEGSMVVYLQLGPYGAVFSEGRTNDGEYTWKLEQHAAPIMSIH